MSPTFTNCLRPWPAPVQLQKRSHSRRRASTTRRVVPCPLWLLLCSCMPCPQRRVECQGMWTQRWPCTMLRHRLDLFGPPNGSSTAAAAPQRLQVRFFGGLFMLAILTTDFASVVAILPLCQLLSTHADEECQSSFGCITLRLLLWRPPSTQNMVWYSIK